jgi:DNA-binding response OmpR family regulator
LVPTTRDYSYTVTLDDDPIVPRLIETTLRIPTRAFADAAKLVEAAPALNPVAVFIDIHLNSDSTGISILPALRQAWPFAPIIVITADPSDEAVSEALASGADDFVRKPLRPKELIARVQTRLVDQAQKEARQLYHFSNLELNQQSRCLRGPKSERFLSPTEMSLYLALTQARGTVVSRKVLKQRCWDNVRVSDNALDRKVHELRKVLMDVGGEVSVGTSYGAGFFILMENGTLNELVANQGK